MKRIGAIKLGTKVRQILQLCKYGMLFLRKILKFVKLICQIRYFVVPLRRQMEEMRYDREDLESALRVLRSGGIIVYPTDTVWGIGCDATNADAVRKIYALKQREDSKSMLLLLDSSAKLNYYIPDIPDTAWQLLEATEDTDSKPMTIIYPNARNVAENLLAEDGSVGIRITSEAFSRALCQQLRHPIVSTSANISGQPTAHFYGEIAQEILDGADYVCRYRRGEEVPFEPSTIIKIHTDGTFKIIRP